MLSHLSVNAQPCWRIATYLFLHFCTAYLKYVGASAAYKSPLQSVFYKTSVYQSQISVSICCIYIFLFFLQVRPVAEDEMFKVLKSGKRQKKSWKRMITKVTFVGQGFTRKPPKYERFIRPTGGRGAGASLLRVACTGVSWSRV